MSFSSDSNNVSIEEDVEQALLEIDNKYSQITAPLPKMNNYSEMLTILSHEFDSLGLPAIHIQHCLPEEILGQVLTDAHALVQIHRKTLQRLQNTDITNQAKDMKNADLLRKIESYKIELARSEQKCYSLQNVITKLGNDIADLEKKVTDQKEEMQKLKKYFASKQNEACHNLNRQIKENDHLKKIFRKEHGHYVSKDDITVELLNKYKINEEIYKETIQKLQHNNTELISEVLNLKEDLYRAQIRNDS